MTDAALVVDAVSAGYGAVPVLRDVSLALRPGEMFGLFGANGAGKSTLLKAVSGLIPITAGTVGLQARTLNDVDVERRVALGLAHVPEGRRVFPGLTVLENLKTARLREGTRVAERLRFVCELFPVLQRRAGQRAWSLSGGEQQMLSVARALMSTPSVMLMDEPSLGLAPQVVHELFESLRRLVDEGLAVLVVEQNIRVALRYVRRFAVLKGGMLIGERASDAQDAEALLEEVYLGGRRLSPALHTRG
jgi:branched-chain amino acid transport system ATP-binding protein